MQPKADHSLMGTAWPGSSHLAEAEAATQQTSHLKAEPELDSVHKSASQIIIHFFMQSVRENKLEICFSEKIFKIII